MHRAEERLRERGGARELLRAPAALFALAAALRGGLYDRRLLPSARLAVPVVSVGNLTVGGTGKTPVVAHLARMLLERGRRPGVLSRGYRALAESSGESGVPHNDEGRLLARLLPGVPQVQKADRVAGGLELVAAGADVVLLDDGFQHRRLARDLDLVLVDATRPWGLPAPRAGGRPVCALLPRGFLREAPAALERAHAIAITRCDQVEERELDALRAELTRIAPGPARLELAQVPARLVDETGEVLPLAHLAGRAVDLASAIGNPEAFEATVRGLGAEVAEHRVRPDHWAWTAADLAGVGEGRPLVTTAKDAVKLEALGRAFLVVELEVSVRAGGAVLAALLDALPAGEAERGRAALHEGLHG